MCILYAKQAPLHWPLIKVLVFMFFCLPLPEEVRNWRIVADTLELKCLQIKNLMFRSYGIKEELVTGLGPQSGVIPSGPLLSLDKTISPFFNFFLTIF